MALWTLMRELLSLSNLVGPLAEKVVGAGVDGLCWAFSSLSRLLDVEADLDKLRRTVRRIHALLKDAEETRFIEDSHVRLWLSELKDIAFDAEDLLDEIETRVNVSKLQASQKRKLHWHSFSINPVWLLSWKISRKVAEIWKKYSAITEDRKNLHLRKGEYRRKAQVGEERLPLEAGSLQGEPLIVGIDDKKREIVQLLISGGGDDVAVVSVVAAGGIGKTTLARLAYDDQEVVNFFPLKFWVGVSQGFDVKKTTKEIIEVMTEERCDPLNLELLQRRLQQLVSGRKFLLVLDGVWNEEQYYWEMLRAPLMAGGNGSRVLVTTRSELVSRNMRTLPPIHLNGLEEEHCWSLFQDLAFERGAWNRHRNLAEIGRKIVKKCQGSPLAVRSIGGLLYNKTDEEEWKSVLSDLPDPDDDAYKILLTLKVSYDHLPLHLKQCFAFCSIFPNGYEFERDELVKLWIAVGLVNKPRGMRSLENIGGKYFDYLLWRSFFHISSSSNQQSKMKYKMPGLIHELAQSVSEHECLRFENNAVHGESGNSRYVVSCLQNMNPFAFQKIYENQGLRSFILLPENGVPTKQVPNHLFRNLKHLRALDLRQNEIVALPDAIGNLIHLRFLNLYGTQIERLPESVSNLYNLLVLELGECNKLLELPKGMSNLVNLRHLGLHLNRNKHRNRWIDLISMPPGIGQLTSLRTLSRFSVSGQSGCGLGQLKDLDLRGELCISKLENVVNVDDAADANLRNKKYIDFLMLRWSESTCSNSLAESGEEVIKNLHPHTNIRTLWIDNYNGTSFPDWLQDQSFSNLDTLRLSNCRRCGVLPLVGKLPQLKNLDLEGLPEVQYMGRVVPGNGNTMGFPLLEMLFIANMRSLESWYEVIQGEMACLKKLVISDCPKIKELSHLPRSLEYFEMRNCQKLSSLPNLMLPLLQELVIKGGTGEIIRWIHQLTSLSSLTVSQLSRLKSLPRGYLHNLKVLRELKIEGCDKLKSVALQDLASLELLEISSCQKLSSFGDGGLPATLKEFRLRFCDNLKSLPTQMHLLPSLNHMEICNVPMLTSFPTEGLPYSLKYLAISGCALLQRCCERNGADWPKIQHIPLRDIGDSSSS